METEYTLKYPNHPYFEDDQETTVTYTLKSYPRNGGDAISRDFSINVSSLYDKIMTCFKAGSNFEIYHQYWPHSQSNYDYGYFHFTHLILFLSVEPALIFHTLKKGFQKLQLDGTKLENLELKEGNRMYTEWRLTKDTQAGESSSLFKLVYSEKGKDAHRYQIHYDIETQKIVLKVTESSGELFRRAASGFSFTNGDTYIDTQIPPEMYTFDGKQGELKNPPEQ